MKNKIFNKILSIIVYRFFLILFLLFPCLQIHAAILKGIVKDEKNQPLPYASVYIKGTTNGTTTNVDGIYQIEIKEGTYTIVYQFVGYQKQEINILIHEGINSKNIQLLPTENTLKEIVIKQNENLALSIIKKAIKKRSYYNKQVEKFYANAYIKGNFRLNDISLSGLLNMFGTKDTASQKEIEDMKGILFLSESYNEIAYKRPEKLKIKVLSSRVSGSSNSYGFSEPMFVNLYDNNVALSSDVNPRGFISPIAETAFLYYKYELLGAYMEDGKLINRIKVIPRRKFEPLFSGIIEIVENEWRLHTVDIYADKEHQLEMLDTIKIKQIYVPTQNYFMVKDQSFYLKASILGLDIVGNYVNTFSNYQFDFDEKKIFNKFLIEYDNLALKRDYNFWDSLRPVPLETEEIQDFIKKDSIEKSKIINNTKIVKTKNNFKNILLSGFVFGDTFNKISTSPILGIDNIDWNTVEGFNYRYSIAYRKKIKGLNFFKNNLTLRYGQSNQQLNFKFKTTYNWGSTNKSFAQLSMGRYFFQYNNEEPVNYLLNAIGTLYYGINYLKIYRSKFIDFHYKYQHISSFEIALQSSYQIREPQLNSTLYTWSKKTKFTENYPTEIASGYEPTHHALIAKIGVSYQPGRQYIKYPNQIVSIPSKYPTIGASIQFGLPFFLSDVSYSKWAAQIDDDMNFKLLGKMNYKISIGGFIYNHKSYIPDYTHFNGNQFSLATPYLNSFQLAPYYLNSNTEQFYTTLHIEHHFNGLFTNKIPLFRRLKWYLVGACNTYYVNQSNNYIELSAGLENIGFKMFRFLRVDGVVGYTNFTTPVYGIRLGLSGVLTNAIFIKNDN